MGRGEGGCAKKAGFLPALGTLLNSPDCTMVQKEDVSMLLHPGYCPASLQQLRVWPLYNNKLYRNSLL